MLRGSSSRARALIQPYPAPLGRKATLAPKEILVLIRRFLVLLVLLGILVLLVRPVQLVLTAILARRAIRGIRDSREIQEILVRKGFRVILE